MTQVEIPDAARDFSGGYRVGCEPQRSERSRVLKMVLAPGGRALPGANEPVAPTHWSFGPLAGLVGAPAAYLRQFPAPLAGINLQYGLTTHRAEQVTTLEIEDGRVELRAVTGPDYGRIFDHELVDPVRRFVAHSDEFLRKRGFSKAETAKIIETVLAEEGHAPSSVFDFVQGIAAIARDKPHQDARLDLEARAKTLLDRAA